jgi:hypothetical protein
VAWDAPCCGPPPAKRSAGIKKISLSVERNHARGLYLAEGYEVIASGAVSDVMIKEL